jgi:uncharacterized protein DUF262/uncharacterized protein DUF1524
MARSEINFEQKGIGAILSHNRLVVPLNQREYSWERDHVQELFQDFSNALTKSEGSYFLGTIVLTKAGGDSPEVSDGQQRLATTSILIAAIRDYFFAQQDNKRAGAIADTYLRTIDLKTTDIVPKLRLNVDDQEFFRKLIISDADSKDRKVLATRQSHKRIADAADTARAYVVDFLKPYKQTAHSDRLIELIEFIDQGAQVIALRVPDHINAFVMFETLNDRGLKASQADLLKNHLLSLCAERINEGQQKWASMVGVLESLEQDEITVTYLHHMLINKYGPIREREVFDRIKSTVNSQLGALEFLDELADGASHYAALFNPDHKKWNEYGTLTRKNLKTINRDLRVSQIKPLMFAVARRFSIPEAKVAFRFFVFWSVRFLIVGGRGGLLDRNYSLAAFEVANGTITTAAGLATKLGEILPGDAVFLSAFSEAKIAQNYFARYLLRAMEQQQNKVSEPEFVPSDDENSINLEHVLPENPGAQWPGVDSDTATALFRRIGNLVLLQASQNTLIGNSPFAVKKPILADSKFILTQNVANNSTWGSKEISERQGNLAQLAVQTWPLSL